MLNKYEIRTYPENYIQEKSESDSENELDNLPFKKATYVNENENAYPDERITSALVKEANNNITYIQQNINNKKKSLKHAKINNKQTYHYNFPKNYEIGIINKNKNNKRSHNGENINNQYNNFPKNRNTNLNKYFNINEIQEEIFPKKSVKTYQNQFLDVERKDNFRVLSYRPEDYETDYSKPNGKSKIIQLFKKQEASELFFPSKRSKSPSSNPQSNNNSANKKEKGKDKDKSFSFYQGPSLKFQSFFGSFMRPGSDKNSNKIKSTSKVKKNQLEDFNIEKLIEIGDNANNKWNNILTFGQKIKKMRNTIKMQRKLQKEKFVKYRVKTENNLEEENGETFEIKPIQRIELDRKDYNLMRSYNLNNINNKKMVYHGQIKRKRNIKQTKPYNNAINSSNNRENNKNIIRPNTVIKSRRFNTSVNNIKNNIIINSNSNSKNKSKKIIKMNPNSQERSEFFYQGQNIKGYGSGNNTPNYINRKIIQRNNTDNGLGKKISPSKTQQNKRIIINKENQSNSTYKTNNRPNSTNTNNSNKFHYSIKHFSNTDNDSEGNKYISFSSMNKNKNIKKESPKKNILSEIKELDYNENNDNDIIKEKKIGTKNKVIIDEEKLRKKQSVYNGGVKEIKKESKNDVKSKRYYGYDDRHYLEGIVNNHSMYVSVYTKKAEKIN